MNQKVNGGASISFWMDGDGTKEQKELVKSISETMETTYLVISPLLKPKTTSLIISLTCSNKK